MFNWDVILYNIFYQQVLPLVSGCQQMNRLLRQAFHLRILTSALHKILNSSPPTRLAIARILLSFSAFLIQTQNRSTTLVIVMTWEFVINLIIICFISIMFSISYQIDWLISQNFKNKKHAINYRIYLRNLLLRYLCFLTFFCNFFKYFGNYFQQFMITFN